MTWRHRTSLIVIMLVGIGIPSMSLAKPRPPLPYDLWSAGDDALTQTFFRQFELQLSQSKLFRASTNRNAEAIKLVVTHLRPQMDNNARFVIEDKMRHALITGTCETGKWTPTGWDEAKLAICAARAVRELEAKFRSSP